MLKRLIRPVGDKQAAQSQVAEEVGARPTPDRNASALMEGLRALAAKREQRQKQREDEEARNPEEQRLSFERHYAAFNKMWSDYAKKKKEETK